MARWRGRRRLAARSPPLHSGAVFAHGLKWPQAVQHFVRQWERPPQASSQPHPQQLSTTGEQIVAHFHSTFAWLSDKPSPLTHEGMSHGLMQAVSGAAMFGLQLGMVTEASSPSGGTPVWLGPAQKEYLLQPLEAAAPARRFAERVIKEAASGPPLGMAELL